jgi:glycosyltransferase involved in cell wall biosynthesis
MKLLMTCDAVGGVWQYANELAAGLADAGIDIVLAVLGPMREQHSSGNGPKTGTGFSDTKFRFGQGSIPAQGRPGEVLLVETHLPLDWLAAGPDEVLHAGRTIAALAAEHAVDLVHLNSPALAAAGPFPAPTVAVAHGCVGTWFAVAEGAAPPAGLAWHEQLMLAGLLAADVVVAPSASYAAAVKHHYALPTSPLVVYNGRTPAPFVTAGPADHVLTAGRLWDRVKNTGLLDDVAARLPVPFRAAGPITAPHGESVATSQLQLLGELNAAALAAEYGAAPIFVSAATFEPFGLAVLEAAQAGCPLVLSDIDTFRELWTGAALFVSDQDASAYAAAIARIRSEPGLRAHLGEAARQRAARYTAAAMAAGMLAIYQDALATPQRAAA